MASKTERMVINGAGLVQGIVLVTFPAASTIFTEESGYGLYGSQYGAMFLPQVALAITTSLLGAALARRITARRVYLLGLACSTISMVLLLASTLVKANQAAAYPVLLAATAFLGAGFGLTVPVLNTYTSVFNPGSVDRSVLVLNALLGLGTALAPVLVALFTGLGFWWGLPVLSAALLAGLLAAGARPLAARAGHLPRPAPRPGRDLPAHQRPVPPARGSGDRHLRAGGPGLLGAAAADHQLRRGGPHRDRRRHGRRRDRLLPARLRHRRVRRRPAGRLRRQPVTDLRVHRHHRRHDGPAVPLHHPPPHTGRHGRTGSVAPGKRTPLT